MRRTYLRPIALSYGPAARQAIAEMRAGPLGGSGWIGFHAAEVISRIGKTVARELVAYGDLTRDDRLAAVEGKRTAIAGVSLDRPQVMGIVNVTPDSFSDGGLNADAGHALAHGMALAAEGAAILDVGGESTRPGSEGVSEDEELRRILPVIKGLSLAGHVVSCDTRKANVMREAWRAGARIINDVSALQHDPESLSAVAELKCPVVLMHAQGDPKTMQLSPVYNDVAIDVFDALEARIAECVAAGIDQRQIVVDPGIGFGKTFRHNLDVLGQADRLSWTWGGIDGWTFAQGLYRCFDWREGRGKTGEWLGWRCYSGGSKRSAYASCA